MCALKVGITYVIIPPADEVYRGYIDFVFSITLFVCVCVFVYLYMCVYKLVCVKDFSGTTGSRNLKFGTNIWYSLLYCVRENQGCRWIGVGRGVRDPLVHFLYFLLSVLYFSLAFQGLL